MRARQEIIVSADSQCEGILTSENNLISQKNKLGEPISSKRGRDFLPGTKLLKSGGRISVLLISRRVRDADYDLLSWTQEINDTLEQIP